MAETRKRTGFYWQKANTGRYVHGAISGITMDGKVGKKAKGLVKSRRGIEIIRIRYVTEKIEEECQRKIRRRFSRKRKSYL